MTRTVIFHNNSRWLLLNKGTTYSRQISSISCQSLLWLKRKLQEAVVLRCSSKEVFLRILKEKTTSNKTPAVTKSTNLEIWVVSTSNQFFIRGSYTEKKNKKNKVVAGKTPFFVTSSFCTHYSIWLNIGVVTYGSFVWK